MNKFTSGAHEIILKRIRDIPSLPEVVNKTIPLLGEADVPASKIAQLISYDPGLTSKVLRMVNSAAYGFQRQISSIQHGIMILGFNTVRGLVLSASIFKMFEHQTGTGAAIGARRLNHLDFWRHSLSTAMAARLIGQSLKMPETDDAFSAGMLHDIGKVVLDVYFTQDYVPVLDAARKLKQIPHGPAFVSLETATLGTDHAKIGAFLAQKWKLPTGITEVIQYHHEPELAEHSKPLVYLVALASQMAVVLYDYKGIYNRSYFNEETLKYFELYDVDDEDLEGFLMALKADLDAADELLASISARDADVASS